MEIDWLSFLLGAAATLGVVLIFNLYIAWRIYKADRNSTLPPW